MNKVAIIGSGNIGTDLGERLISSTDFELVAIIGRRQNSPGLQRFKGRVKFLESSGLFEAMDKLEEVDGFFDATSASDHENHWELLKQSEKWVIDLTPSRIGRAMVPILIGQHPSMDISDSLHANYSMVTCGGQSAAPIIYALANIASDLYEVEVSSSISSNSAGPATRRNIDQYIASTESLIRTISGCENAKAILVLNPAIPPVHMRTTITLRVESISLASSLEVVQDQEKRMQTYIPGFKVITPPKFLSDGILTLTVGVEGSGYFLPPYAGNLDIINSAAVETARLHVKHKLLTGRTNE